MDSLSMCSMDITLFRKVVTDDVVYYTPINIKNCFFKKSTGIKFVDAGFNPKNSDTSVAVVPISSLSSIDEVSPNVSDPPSYFGGAGMFKQDDFIARGTYTDSQYTTKSIAVLPECFCVKLVTEINFSSIPCFILKGE